MENKVILTAFENGVHIEALGRADELLHSFCGFAEALAESGIDPFLIADAAAQGISSAIKKESAPSAANTQDGHRDNITTFNNITNRNSLSNNSMKFCNLDTTAVIPEEIISNELCYRRSILLSFESRIHISS